MMMKPIFLAMALGVTPVAYGQGETSDKSEITEQQEEVVSEKSREEQRREWRGKDKRNKQGHHGMQGKQGKHKKFGKRHGKRGGLGKFSRVWKKLDLTEKQRDQLFELQQTHKREAFENQMSHERAQFEFHKALGQEKLDDGDLESSAGKIGESAKKRAMVMVGFVKKVRDILTPDQAKKLHELMGKMGPNFDGPPPH